MTSTKKVLFLFPDPPGFSGQRVAAQMTCQAIDSDDRFSCTTVALPGFPKTGNRFVAVPLFIIKSLLAYFRFFVLSTFCHWDGLFVAVSQTQKAIARDQTLIRFFKIRHTNKPVVFRIDSSIFTRWDMEQPEAIKFRKLLTYCNAVSTLGPVQQTVLESKFVGKNVMVTTIPNTCEIDCLSEVEIANKHEADEVTRVLHLSSLMEPKGYAHLLDATASPKRDFELVICGRLTQSAFDVRFNSIDQQKEHLETLVDERANLKWIDGAIGDPKKRLFTDAHIFVFPSWYPVEAQPLVLLEAMASGCAIITTGIGEIPFIVGEDDAVIVEGQNIEQISDAIEELVASPAKRKQLALRGRQIFLEKFDFQSHQTAWRSLAEHHLLTTNN